MRVLRSPQQLRQFGDVGGYAPAVALARRFLGTREPDLLTGAWGRRS
jgi:hypothetical protein